MKVRVYVPQTLNIPDAELPALREAARKRLRLADNVEVPARQIIEEARRAGVIELGRDYCLDLEDEALNLPIRRRAAARRQAANGHGANGSGRAGDGNKAGTTKVTARRRERPPHPPGPTPANGTAAAAPASKRAAS